MSDCYNDLLNEFVQNNGLSGVDMNNVKAALTHPSYTNDMNLPYSECYERLEFLGDAVLKLIASDILYKKYPDFKEGKMTNLRAGLVSDEFILNFANELNLSKYIRISASLEKDGGREIPSILACAFEALLGAMFESGFSYDKIFNFVEILTDKYFNLLECQLPKFNSKSILQEYTQSVDKTLPEYVTEAVSSGFSTRVIYHNDTIGVGTAKTKKEAEREAAYNACVNLFGEKNE